MRPEALRLKGGKIKLGKGTEVPGSLFIYTKDKQSVTGGQFQLKD